MSTQLKIDDARAFANAFDVSRETIEKLETYAELLKRWQTAVNLIAPSTLGQLWSRHFADSAQLLQLFPDHAHRHADIGSGGGFPGLVLAIMRAERSLGGTVLVESDQRKAAFLREVARSTGIVVEILCGRIETAATCAKVGIVDVVTARAVAPLNRLFALTSPICSESTLGLFPKGKGVEQELVEARQHWRFDHKLVPSLTQEGAAVVEVMHLKPMDGRV